MKWSDRIALLVLDFLYERNSNSLVKYESRFGTWTAKDRAAIDKLLNRQDRLYFAIRKRRDVK